MASCIEATYDELTRRTKVPCQSVTFWRTVSDNWGARAGLGETVFAEDLERAISLAIVDGIRAHKHRARVMAAFNKPVPAEKTKKAHKR